MINLTPASLIDDKKTFQLQLVSQDAKKIVEYKNYQLKMTLSAASGDLKGSKIKYKSFDTGKPVDQEMTSAPVTKDLTHFFKGAVLEPGDTPEENFIIEPGRGAGKLTFKVELLDALENDKSVKICEGTWEPGPPPAFDINITNKDTSDKIFVNKKIQLQITKRGASDEILTKDLDRMALKIERTKGSEARISTASDDDKLYILSPVNVTLSPDKKSASLELMIEPGADKRARFKLEPVSEEDRNVPIGNVEEVEWENGAKLELEAVYEDADPANKKVKITVKNTGKLELPDNKAKLSWDTRSAQVIIEGKQQGEKYISKLTDGQNIVFDLDKITFVDPNAFPSAELTLKLIWDELEKPEEGTCLLTAVPVDVTLTAFKFDKATSQIKYNIKNNHPTTAIDLDLHCDNKNPGTNKASIITGLPVKLNLPPNMPLGEQILQVDFQNEDEAYFNIALFLGSNPINFKYDDGSGEKSESTVEVRPVAKQVKLKLIDDAGNDFAGDKISRRGANKEIKFKVVLDGAPDDVVALNVIDKARLKLAIDKNHAGDAKLLKGVGPDEVEKEIPGDQLKIGDVDNTITLNLQRGSTNGAIFKLQLTYNKKNDGNFQNIGVPLTIEWEEDEFELTFLPPIEDNVLIGNNTVGKVKLVNRTSEMDPTKVNLIVKSSNEDVIFWFVKANGDHIKNGTGDDIVEKATLAELLNDNNLIGKDASKELCFKFGAAKNGETSADLTVIIERDNQIIDESELIQWGATEADIIDEQEGLFSKKEMDELLDAIFSKGTKEVTKREAEGKFENILQNSQAVILRIQQEIEQGIQLPVPKDQQEHVKQLIEDFKEPIKKELISIVVNRVLNNAFQGGKQRVNRKQLQDAIQQIQPDAELFQEIMLGVQRIFTGG
ncbi:MAG: hypothetical protein BGO68_00500 [Candidatus Amoebophilus sp. 36-38]|nr:MAG: hypothetical protein BGO68_00500 [Candidatus Amoebophilus sp. 36-38]